MSSAGSKKKEQIREKKIAMLSDEPFLWKTCAKNFFKVILHNYKWSANGVTYKFTVNDITDKQIRQGELINSKYDLLLIPGGGVGDGHSITKGFNSSPIVKKWKKNIQDFVKAGGGVMGFCGGSALITPLTTGDTRKPTTFCERQYNKSSLGITNTYSYYEYLAFPLLYPFQLKHPERIGTTAYVFSFKPTKNTEGDFFHSGGVPMKIHLSKDNPIFADYPKDTLTVRWWGGAALSPQENPDRNVSICATYPSKELHEDDKTRIHAWRYKGGFLGLVKGFFKSMRLAKEEDIGLFDALMFSYYFAEPWELSNTLIKSYLADRPCIVTEEYPNEHKARIILCSLHPEYMVWWDGRIEEGKDNTFSLADGLYQWKEISTLKKPLDDNLTHTWWVVRRFAAWATKVPDNHMPPIEKQIVPSDDFEKLKRSLIWDETKLNHLEAI